jgi:hypothetical protein
MVCIAGVLLTIAGTYNFSGVVMSARAFVPSGDKVSVQFEGVIYHHYESYYQFRISSSKPWSYTLTWNGTSHQNTGSSNIDLGYGMSYWQGRRSPFKVLIDDVSGEDNLDVLLQNSNSNWLPIDIINSQYCYPEPTPIESPTQSLRETATKSRSKKPKATQSAISLVPESPTESEPPTESRSASPPRTRRVKVTPTGEFSLSDSWTWSDTWRFITEEAFSRTDLADPPDRMMMALVIMVAIVLVIAVVLLLGMAWRKIRSGKKSNRSSSPPASE